MDSCKILVWMHPLLEQERFLQVASQLGEEGLVSLFPLLKEAVIPLVQGEESPDKNYETLKSCIYMYQYCTVRKIQSSAGSRPTRDPGNQTEAVTW